MNASNVEDEGKEQLIATDAKIDSVPAATPSPAANVKALIVGILLAVAGAWIAANLADRLRFIENVDSGVKLPGLRLAHHATRLNIGRASQNAAVAYALARCHSVAHPRCDRRMFPGAFFDTACFGRRSRGHRARSFLRRGEFLWAHSHLFSPIGNGGYHPFITHPPGNLDGRGSSVGRCFRSWVGKSRRARPVLGRRNHRRCSGNAPIRHICAFLPLARTERPLSEEAGTRLAANIVLCLCVAIGIVVVASQKPRVTANKA